MSEITTTGLQRYCNGCGRALRDATEDELHHVLKGLKLPDIRHDCPDCSRAIERWSARDVLKVLAQRHTNDRSQRRQWAFVEELRIGLNRPQHPSEAARRRPDYEATEDLASRIDAWAMHAEKQLCVSYEVKTSVEDWRRELAEPDKRLPAMAVSHEFYFVAPERLIDPIEIPEGCGLIEVRRIKRGGLKAGATSTIRVQAPWREMDDLPWHFIASLAARAA